MTNIISILETAISDVGYWRWWDEALPDLFQVEFGGVTLWTPPTQHGMPPPGIVALGFKAPSVVAFLSDISATELRKDWRVALQKNEIEPSTLDEEEFTLESDAQITTMIEGCSIEFLVGTETELSQTKSSSKLAFRAGPVGLVVIAQQMAIRSLSGDLTYSHIEEAAAAW